MSKLSVHWQRTHPDKKDGEYFGWWKPYHIKIIVSSDTDIPGLDTALNYIYDDGANRGKVIVRHHMLSELWNNRGFSGTDDARAKGRYGANFIVNTLWPIARDAYGAKASDLLWTGLNEPNVWASETPELTSIYYEEFMNILHAAGLFVMALNIGVGWPTNGGITDAPPIWEPFEPIKNAMIDGDVLGLHEYWGMHGPQEGWGWLAGRYTQCPWDVPIVIGECGIDAAVINGGDHYGFHGLSTNHDEAANIYMGHLAWYDDQLQNDPRIQSAMPFTYDFSHPWSTFNLKTDQFMYNLYHYIGNNPVEPPAEIVIPEPEPEPEEWGNQYITAWKDLVWKYCNNVDIPAEYTTTSTAVIGTIIWLESSGDPDAINESSGAVGLMQVMPKSDRPGFENRPTTEELLDPETNIKWGTEILKYNLNRYKSMSKPLERALAGYYGGNDDATNLNSEDSLIYLNTFCMRWDQLWSEECPVTPGEPEDPDIDFEDIKQELAIVRDYLTEVESYLEKATTMLGKVDTIAIDLINKVDNLT